MISSSEEEEQLPTFETTFAVPLHCQSCIDSVQSALTSLPGIQAFSASLPDQLVSVRGNASISSIVGAIQATGRDAILRGSGSGTEGSAAAVCILETHSSNVSLGEVVRGLVRFVEVSSAASSTSTTSSSRMDDDGGKMVLADMTLKGVSPGSYKVTVRETGDVTRGCESSGGIWEKGMFGTIEVGQSGLGTVFIDRPVRIWEMIGRGIVVSRSEVGREKKEDPDTLVGVVARSAGVWDNDKSVCSCSGKTVWEERKEQRGKGML